MTAAAAKIGTWTPLVDALSLERRELVALTGAGGKTSALLRGTAELAARGKRVIATTTTAMYEWELAQVGPLVLEADSGAASARLRRILAASPTVGVATRRVPEGKVKGLSSSAVDSLWEVGLADYLLVEADGSRGLPLKAFGPDEPVVPARASTVIVVAGLCAIGSPLTESHVHRAGRMAAAQGIALGDEVTSRVFVEGVRRQLSALRQEREERRIISLLTSANSPAVRRLGLVVADELLRRCEGQFDVILADLREGRAARVEAVAT